jgi:GxxExxY protein
MPNVSPLLASRSRAVEDGASKTGSPGQSVSVFSVCSVVQREGVMLREPVPVELNRVTERIIGAAMAVHCELGPGFLESIYSTALCIELSARALPFEKEKAVEVVYRGVSIRGQRVDLVVGEQVLVEVKAVSAIEPIHVAQVVSYLKTTGLRIGLLVNFHERLLKDGIRRVVL